MKTLKLDGLQVETFEVQGPEAAFAAKKPNLRDSECDGCGIACTVIDCPVPSARYTDCGSCGIACTVVEC